MLGFNAKQVYITKLLRILIDKFFPYIVIIDDNAVKFKVFMTQNPPNLE